MASSTYLDGQSPIWRTPSGSQSITIDPTLQSITVENTTIPKKIIINPIELSNGTQVLPYTQLYENINAVDAAVWPAPNATTMQVENQIAITDTPNNKSVVIDATIPQIQIDGGVGLTNTLSSQDIVLTDGTNAININGSTHQITLTDGTYVPYITIASNRLYITGNSTGVDIDSSSNVCRIGDVNISNNGTLIELNDTHNNVDLRTRNFTTQGDTYTFPICFSSKSSGNVNYSSPSNWQQVFHYSIPFPAFAIDSTSIYNVWKIEFHMNTSNMTDQTNKECAMYFEIEDASSAIYTGFLFNNATPYTGRRDGSTYSATSQQSENYGWTDYFDFTGMNGNTPLEFKWYWFANGTNSYDFNWLVSFTRTNLI